MLRLSFIILTIPLFASTSTISLSFNAFVAIFVAIMQGRFSFLLVIICFLNNFFAEKFINSNPLIISFLIRLRESMNNSIRKALHEYPVFTVRDLASLLNKERGYAYLQAYRWKKRNLIYEIEKGKYTVEEDPFIISSWIIWPSYISGWAALHFYHLTEQLPFTIQVITSRKRNKRIINYGNAKIEFTTVRPSFLKGYKQVIYQQKNIFIAEKEKALVDALAARKMTFTEGIGIIKDNRKNLNLKKLFFYAAMVKGLAAKLRRELHD